MLNNIVKLFVVATKIAEVLEIELCSAIRTFEVFKKDFENMGIEECLEWLQSILNKPSVSINSIEINVINTLDLNDLFGEDASFRLWEGDDEYE